MTKSKKSLVIVFALIIALALMTTTSMFAFADTPDYSDRVFNPKYDAVFEDFDRADVSDTVSVTGDATVAEKAYLSVELEDGATDSTENAVYKQALPGDNNRGYLVLYMRSHDLSVLLSDLKLGTRYNDSYPVYQKSMADLLDEDANPLPELTANWQKYIISFANSYESSEVYEGSSVAVNSGIMVGIHIFSVTGETGTMDFQTIYFTTDMADAVPATRTMLNNFVGGATVDKTAHGDTWWCGSPGAIVKRSVSVDNGGAAEIVNAAKPNGSYGYAVIEAENTDDLTVSVYNGTTFAAAVPYSKVIALDGAVTGFKFESSGAEAVIHRIFYTNFEEDVILSEYPRIDASAVQKFDHFNVNQSGFNANYDEMAARPELSPSGLFYRISYNNGNLVTVTDGAIVFDATNLGEGYINFKEASTAPNIAYKYLVFKMKGENGANLQGFRFSTGTNPIVYGNGGLKSGAGLPIADLTDAKYPYTTADGWRYIVIDVAESGLNIPETGIDTLDMYYSGTGKLYIDEIFWANAKNGYTLSEETIELANFNGETLGEGFWWTDTVNASLEDGAAKLSVASESDYAMFGGANPVNNKDSGYRYLVLRMKTDGTLSMETFRIMDATNTTVYFNSGAYVSNDGKNFPELTSEYQDFIIDLAASGLQVDMEGLRIYIGGWQGTGNLFIDSIQFAERAEVSTANIKEDLPFTPTKAGYEYAGGFDAVNADGMPYLALVMSGAEGASLSDVRIEFADLGTKWFSANAEGQLFDQDGNALAALTTDVKTFIIDLEKSGIDPAAITAFHIHTSGTATGAFTIEKAYFMSYKLTYSDIMENLPVYATPDWHNPEITLNVPATAVEGTEITVAPVVTDDMSQAANITVEITVTLGANQITLTNGKFTAAVGTYTVTVVATDEAGNETTLVKQITVTAADVEPEPQPEPEDNSGLSIGEIIAIAVGSFVLLCAAGAVIYIVLKRKRAQNNSKK